MVHIIDQPYETSNFKYNNNNNNNIYNLIFNLL